MVEEDTLQFHQEAFTALRVLTGEIQALTVSVMISTIVSLLAKPTLLSKLRAPTGAPMLHQAHLISAMQAEAVVAATTTTTAFTVITAATMVSAHPTKHLNVPITRIVPTDTAVYIKSANPATVEAVETHNPTSANLGTITQSKATMIASSSTSDLVQNVLNVA